LTLYLTVYVSHDGQNIDNVSLSREIVVTVSPLRAIKNFAGSNWQWVVSTLVGSGLITALVTKGMARRRRSGVEQDLEASGEPVKSAS
jgi:hypothetical protein